MSAATHPPSGALGESEVESVEQSFDGAGSRAGNTRRSFTLANFSIRARLTGFGLVGVVLAVCVGLVGEVGLRSVSNGLREVLETSQILRNHLESDMMHDAIRGDVLGAMLAQTPQGRDQVRAELEEHSNTFNELLAANLALVNDAAVHDALVAAQPALESYVRSAGEISAAAAIDAEHARAALPEFQAAFGLLEERMEALSDLIQGNAAVRYRS